MGYGEIMFGALTDIFNKIDSSWSDSRLARYQALFEHAPAGYFVLHPDSRIASANATAVALSETAADKLAGLAFSDLITPDSRPALARLLGQNEPVCVQFKRTGQWLRLTTAGSPDDDSIFLIATEIATEPGN